MIARNSEAEMLRAQIAELSARLRKLEASEPSRQSRECRVFGYTRVSTEEQKKGTSLDLQDQRIREFHAQRYGGMPYGTTLVDDGISAYKVALFDRPQGKLFKNILQKGDVVVFWNIDRAFRSMYDCVTSMQWFMNRGIRIVFMDQPEIEFDTMVGKLIVTILAWAAEFESRRKSERMKESCKYRKEKGRRMNERGYGRNWAGRRDASFPVWDLFEVAIIGEVKRLRESGLSQEAISWIVETELCRRDGRDNINTLKYRSPEHKWTEWCGRKFNKNTIHAICRALQNDDELREYVEQRADRSLFRVSLS